jgi:CRISPR-associated endonuclease Cas3-HD
MSSYSKLISHPHQPFSKHLAEVDNISARALGAKFIASSFASRERLEFWRRLLVYFHDFGKSTVYFQHKIVQAVLKENPEMDGVDADYVEGFYKKFSRFELEEELADDSQLGTHAQLGAFVQQASLPEESLLHRAILLEIVKRHHGDLRNFDDRFILEPDRESQLKQQWMKADKEDYIRIIESFGFTLPAEIDPLLISYGSARMFRKLNKELPTKDIQPYVLTLFLFSLLLRYNSILLKV